jgi:orotidine-5'-phosphate decarboxylase
MPHRRIVFPLDYPSLAEGKEAADRLAGSVGVLKVGLELFTKEGPAAFEVGRPHGLDVFADLKLHDIPETVERAIASAASYGVRYVTVHASGGTAMLARAAERASRESGGKMLVIAITVLTSLDEADLAAIGVTGSIEQHVLRLARVAWSAGVRGFVCSPDEVSLLRDAFGQEVTLVTPGVRPEGSPHGDQKRVATPSAAIARGADLIVIGRPIRDAADPRAAAEAIGREVAQGLTQRVLNRARTPGARS